MKRDARITSSEALRKIAVIELSYSPS